ncbi:MAG: undecaprenyldiphospho-muramoylpentapeptide beta-N-acetylglucosaminyltransferase [Bdellovibrionota bacterium]|nr:MAG: undecaprenyldiphospho-muramoylpentapeptide beta-N-acetylglucosaminyltransferase [Pseudomonadota bacterium]
MTKIVLTGGGTAGHVMPHIAMIPAYKKWGWQLTYIGSAGIEKALIEKEAIPYHTIATGKLRRYLSLQNFTDLFRIAKGFVQSFQLLRKIKPDLVFSKGGFVSVPVAYAAWLLRIPVVSHESDLTPGLANKLIAPFCRFLFYAFPDTANHIKVRDKAEAGIPVRPTLFRGNKDRGLTLCGFERGTPVLLVMGGSLGAERINKALQESLRDLVDQWQVVHLTGKGKGIAFSHPRYKAFEYVNEGLEDIFAATDAVISRAGANSLFELKALRKPMLLIPLDIGSRGDQIHNAESFAKQGWAMVLSERSLTPETLKDHLNRLKEESDKQVASMTKSGAQDDGGEAIIQTLSELLKKK